MVSPLVVSTLLIFLTIQSYKCYLILKYVYARKFELVSMHACFKSTTPFDELLVYFDEAFSKFKENIHFKNHQNCLSRNVVILKVGCHHPEMYLEMSRS